MVVIVLWQFFAIQQQINQFIKFRNIKTSFFGFLNILFELSGHIQIVLSHITTPPTFF